MQKPNNNRRRFLTIATSFIAGAGVATVAVPFLGYWKPSQKAYANAAPVKVDISKIEPGSMITISWQGKPVWILNRTKANLELLKKPFFRDRLRDPDSEKNQQPEYAKNEFRSIKQEILVAVGICTHLGCIPLYKPDGNADEAEGLYFCPCHGSKFDFAGRVYKGVPAPINLLIPPHQYLNDKIIEIGRDDEIS